MDLWSWGQEPGTMPLMDLNEFYDFVVISFICPLMDQYQPPLGTFQPVTGWN